MRDVRRGETKESEDAVRECNPMAEEELWSSLNQVEGQAQNMNKWDWKKPKRGLTRE